MRSYTIKMQKTIVETVNADNEADACAIALASSEDGADGAWDRAEPTCELIHVGADL